MNEEIDYTVLVDYCFDLEATEKNKAELMGCIEWFDIELLYRVLLTDFDHLLSGEERKYYIEKYNGLFDPEWLENV